METTMAEEDLGMSDPSSARILSLTWRARREAEFLLESGTGGKRKSDEA
jgi:hypothetical protein